MTIIDSPLADACRHAGQLPAVANGSCAYTYTEFGRLVGKACVNLTNHGVKTGEKIAIVAETSVDYIVALVALMHLGAIACPVSPRLPNSAIEEYVRRLGCKRMLVDSAPTVANLSIGFIPITNLTSGSESAHLPGLQLDQDSIIIATSGSTGPPKAAVLTLGNLYYNALGSNVNIPIQENDTWLLSLPLYHVGGLGILYRTLLARATILLPEKGQSLGDAIEYYRPTHLSLVHTQLHRLIVKNALSDLLCTCKAILLGGSAFPSALITSAHQDGLRIHASYGLTEMASQVCTTGPDSSVSELLTAGKLLEHRELAISSDYDILVRGRTCFRGYVDREGLVQPFDQAGWFATRDLGRLDSEGNLAVEGRRDNQFISGGENIHPEEVESAFYTFPEVEEVIVVPIDDREFGCRPVAFVKRVDGSSSTGIDYKSALKDVLPGFKIPVACHSWPTGNIAEGLKLNRRYFAALAKELRNSG